MLGARLLEPAAPAIGQLYAAINVLPILYLNTKLPIRKEEGLPPVSPPGPSILPLMAKLGFPGATGDAPPDVILL